MRKLFTFFFALIAGAATLVAESGTGGSLYWNLTDGVLTISGNANMNDYDTYASIAPWHSLRQSITSVVIQDGVKSIGAYAFRECDAMTSVTIPNSVTSIGIRAFDHCAGLTSVAVSASVTNIGNYAFKGCAALTGIEVDDENPNYASADGVLFNKDKTTLIHYPSGNARKEYTIPDGVNSFGDTFMDCALTSLTIPGSVTRIGTSAFYENKALTAVSIAEGVTEIRENAFYKCTALTAIAIPNSVTRIGNYAFRGCKALTSAVIGDGVTDIGTLAFAECSALTSLTIGKSVTTIPGSTFDISNLTSVTWNAKNGERYDFGVGSKITSFVFGEEVESIPANCCQYMNNLTSIIIPNSVTSIGTGAFGNCEGLTSATLGNSVTTIGDNAFWSCVSLKSINLPASVTSIGSAAFNVCSSLTSVVIPDGVTSIERNTFRMCESLTSVTIPASVSSIGEGAFLGCESLASLTIPAGVTSIGKQAFFNCAALTSLTIPDGVTGIEDETFAGCSALTSITIGKNVTSIGQRVFAGCDGITSFDVAADNTNYCTVDGVLFNKDKTTLIQYPSGKEGAYTIPDGVTGFGGAFYYCYGLTSLTIPDGVTGIDDDAFYGCVRLTSVSIPNSVTRIGDAAFAACIALESISIPDGVTTLEPNAFYYCTGLTSATIGNGITTIPNATFWGCSALNTVTIGKNVTGFGNNVFKECPGLKSIIWNARNGTCYDFGSQVESFTFGEEVESIPYKCCYSMSGLKSVTIPNSVTRIGGCAFQYCSGLTDVTIGKNVESIEGYAFYYCTGVQTITCNAATPPACEAEVFTGLNTEEITLHVPDASIAAYSATEPWSSFQLPIAAGSCGENLEWNYSDGVLTISGNGDMEWEGDNAPWASSASYINEIILPAGITGIADYAFYGCSNVQAVSCDALTPPLCGEGAFEGVPECTLRVPCESVQAYSNTEPWSSFEIPSTSGTFGENDRLAWQLSCEGELIISGNGIITPVDELGFAYPWDDYTEDITSVVVEEGITGLSSLFGGYLYNLESLSLPNSLTSIGGGAFNKCEKLTSVSIPHAVTTIGSKAFSNCTGLTTITLGYGLEELEENAFTHSINSLVSVTCFAVTPPVCRPGVFSGMDSEEKLKDITLYVPAQSVGAYEAAEVWKDFNIQPLSEPSEPLILAAGDCGAEEYNLTWEIDVHWLDVETTEPEQGAESDTEVVLTISGTGDMTNWINPALFNNNLSLPRHLLPEGQNKLPADESPEQIAPWYPFREFIQRIAVEEGVTGIGDYAFYGCSNVQAISCDALTPPACGEGAFEDVDRAIPLYVPESSVEAYKDAAQWKEFDVQAEEQQTPTGLEQFSILNSQFSIRKLFRNGVLYLMYNGTMYDVQGRKVE